MNLKMRKVINAIPGTKKLQRLFAVAKKKYRYFVFTEQLKMFKRKNPKGYFLVLTPIHGNLGDHAIAKSEIEILQQIGISYFEIPGKWLYDLNSHGHLSLMNGFPILVNGGGSLGTLWPDDEVVLRNTVLANPESPIRFFPNTIYYEDSEFGKAEFEKAKIIYGTHKNLKIYLREKYSYEISKTVCSDTALVPDMVLRLKYDDNTFERSGCLLCLRSDRERTLTDDEYEIIRLQAESIFDHVQIISTVKEYSIPVVERDIELESFFATIKKAELVITDRLHGMIFCAITGTPCIVINSKSPKVLGCYEWLKDTQYIKFCNDVRSVNDVYMAMPHGSQRFDNSKLLPFYDGLLQDISRLK